MVKEIGNFDSVKIEFTTRCYPNYSLANHWNKGEAQKEIAAGDYDFVIVQQGPSALPESQQLSLTYTKKFAAACKENNAKLCLFTV